jgi:hypothetical protein
MRHRVIRTQPLSAFCFVLNAEVKKMSQIIKRKSTPSTRAGQYICVQNAEKYLTPKKSGKTTNESTTHTSMQA